MVIDKMANSRLYASLHRNLQKAFGFIEDFEKNPLPEGRYKIDGDDVYALVQSYETMPSGQKEWESHRKYMDVQYIFKGSEIIGWAPYGALRPRGPYDESKDALKYLDGPGTELRCLPGTFVLFLPDDLHKPGCVLEQACDIRKVVIKIKI
jgi:biofilm protein TabA